MLFPEAEVTRSLSNLYKSRFVIDSTKEKRIINSNEKVAECMEDYIRMKREEALADGEFVEGLDAESVEVLEEPQEVENAPQVETVSEEERAQSLLETAKAEADQILEDAKMQAEHMREQALEEGRQDGYKAGQEQALMEIQNEQNRLKSLQDDLKNDYDKKCAELEPQLVDVITDVVEKVFQIQFADQKNVLLYLIQNAIQNADGCREFRIHVGEGSYANVSEHKAELAERVGGDLRLDLIEDAALSDDQCMIETEAGVFDCSVGVQMKNLIKEIKALSL